MRQSKRTSWGGPREGAGRPPAEPTKVVRLPLDIAEAARRAAAARGGSGSGIGAFLKGEVRTTASAPLVTASVGSVPVWGEMTP